MPGIGPPLATESGAIITTQSGKSILTNVATSNNNIQLFDFSVNLLRALLWQYNDAEHLQSILEQKQDWYTTNQQEFWESWLRDIFNLVTANEFGLSVWSIILDLPLFVGTPPDPPDKPTFGFDPYYMNFDNGNFSSTSGSTISLPLEIKRLALRLRYFQLTTSGTVPEINRFMAYVFADYGPVYLIDNHDMTQRYVFGFVVTAQLQYLLDNFDILPRPAGVGSSFHVLTNNGFGFNDFGLPFNQGNFFGADT